MFYKNLFQTINNLIFLILIYNFFFEEGVAKYNFENVF